MVYGGWVVRLNDNNAKSALTKVEVKVEAELGNKCICNQKEDMKHIYECKFINEKNTDIKFEEIFGNDIRLQKKIMERFQNNLNMKIMKENEESHVIPFGDPPSSVIIGCGNG